VRHEGPSAGPPAIITQLRVATLGVMVVVGIFVLGILSLLAAYGKPNQALLNIEISVAGGALIGMLLVAFGALVLARTLAKENWDLDRRVNFKTAELLVANEKLSMTVSQLLEATRLKEDVLANVSHELRTPLTLIKVAAATLSRSESELPEAKRKQMLARIDSGIERLIRMVEDLLAYSRLEAGRLKLNSEAGDLGATVEQTVQALMPLAVPRGVTVECLVAAGLEPISFDKARITQIIINLVENALKFTPPGGRVTISVLDDGDTLTLKVADTGEGIAPEHLPHIFERFYQVDRTMSRQHGGTGLGLAVVKSLIELHGGSVSVESQVGAGTVFGVHLPKAAPSDEVAGAFEAAAMAGEGSGK
jgi:signal transduction histidine kinase